MRAVCRLVDHRGRRPPREGLDEWGVTWSPLPADYQVAAGEPAHSYPSAAVAASAAELQPHAFPDPTDPALFAGLLNGVDRDATFIIGQHGLGPLDRFVTLLGPSAAFTALLAEPEASRAALDRIADYHVGIAAGYLAAGVDAGWLADDYAGAAGPIIAPARWRELVMPGLARIIAVYRAAGAAVFFHTCGRAEAFIGDLLDVGVTVFNLQSELCDLAGLKARYGRRIAFFGGVPSGVMLHGTPDEVRRAARTAIARLGRRGGLILAPDQPLAYPPENVAALAEAARGCGDEEVPCLSYAAIR